MTHNKHGRLLRPQEVWGQVVIQRCTWLYIMLKEYFCCKFLSLDIMQFLNVLKEIANSI